LLASFGDHRTKVLSFAPNAELDSGTLHVRSLLNAATTARQLGNEEEGMIFLSHIGDKRVQVEHVDHGLCELNFGDRRINLLRWQQLTEEQLEELNKLRAAQDALKGAINELKVSNEIQSVKAIRMDETQSPYPVEIELSDPFDSVICVQSNIPHQLIKFSCSLQCSIKKTDLYEKELDLRDKMPRCVHTRVIRDDTSGKVKLVGIDLSIEVPKGSIDKDEYVHWIKSLQQTISLAREYFPAPKAAKKTRKKTAKKSTAKKAAKNPKDS